jgi:RNA polymerase sigma-70 factor, ECF subfamily
MTSVVYSSMMGALNRPQTATRTSGRISGIYPILALSPSNSSAPSSAITDADSDATLVDRAKRGDLPAFGAFVLRHQARVFRVVVHIVKDAAIAEEVAQETFVRAFRALASFDGRSEPYTWVYRIAVNLALNVLRSRKTRGTQTNADIDDPRVAGMLEGSGGTPADAAHHKQVYEVLCSGIDALTESLRITLILICIDGVPHETAAAILGVPEGTIAWRIHEARKRLREHFKNCGLDADLP